MLESFGSLDLSARPSVDQVGTLFPGTETGGFVAGTGVFHTLHRLYFIASMSG